MKIKELTPAQSYLLDAFRALANVANGGTLTDEQIAAITARPTTLKSAINAAFYKSVGFGIDRYL